MYNDSYNYNCIYSYNYVCKYNNYYSYKYTYNYTYNYSCIIAVDEDFSFFVVFVGGLGGKLPRYTQLCFSGFYCILLVFVGFRYSKLGGVPGQF